MTIFEMIFWFFVAVGTLWVLFNILGKILGFFTSRVHRRLNRRILLMNGWIEITFWSNPNFKNLTKYSKGEIAEDGSAILYDLPDAMKKLGQDVLKQHQESLNEESDD